MSQNLAHIACHLIQRPVHPRSLSGTASYDYASNFCRAPPHGHRPGVMQHRASAALGAPLEPDKEGSAELQVRPDTRVPRDDSSEEILAVRPHLQLGPAIHCSPCHRMPFNFSDKGSHSFLMSGRAKYSRPCLPHTLHQVVRRRRTAALLAAQGVRCSHECYVSAARHLPYGKELPRHIGPHVSMHSSLT